MRPSASFGPPTRGAVISSRDKHLDGRGRTSETVAGVAIIMGLALVGGALATLTHDHPTPAAFGFVARQPVSSELSVHKVAPASPILRNSGYRSRPAVQASPAVADKSGLSRPVVLQVAALGVSAPVERVVTNGGMLGVPDDISHVGWWTGSALPGSPAGATVIDGHVDSAVDGKGALFHLADLRAGQQITLTTAAGQRFRYQIYARRIYSKPMPCRPRCSIPPVRHDWC